MHHDVEIDTSGLNCPLPILRTKKALASMDSGQILHVIATDPGSVPDFSAYCEHSGHRLLQSIEREGAFHFHLQKY